MADNSGNIEIKGRISSIVYTNEENGYTVLRLETGGGGLVTVTGTLPSAAPGETLRAVGIGQSTPPTANSSRPNSPSAGFRKRPKRSMPIFPAAPCGGSAPRPPR
jgi:hypothetical protein